MSRAVILLALLLVLTQYAASVDIMEVPKMEPARPVYFDVSEIPPMEPYNATLPFDMETCVRNAGYDPNKVFYAYTNDCGAKEKPSIWIAAIRKGVVVEYISIGILSEREKELFKCFYGPYSKTNRNYRICPRLMCPKNGAYKNIKGNGPTISHAGGFMLECR